MSVSIILNYTYIRSRDKGCVLNKEHFEIVDLDIRKITQLEYDLLVRQLMERNNKIKENLVKLAKKVVSGG